MDTAKVESILKDYDALLAVAKKAIENVQHNAVRLRRELGLVSTGANQKPALSEEVLSSVILKRRKHMAKHQSAKMKVIPKRKSKTKAS